MTDSATEGQQPPVAQGDAADDTYKVVSATEWSIADFDEASPFDAQLVLHVGADVAVEVPLDGDLMDALLQVDTAQQDVLAYQEQRVPVRRSRLAREAEEFDNEYDDEDEREGGSLGRVTGWYQMDRFWAGLTNQQRAYLVGGLLFVILLVTLLSRL